MQYGGMAAYVYLSEGMHPLWIHLFIYFWLVGFFLLKGGQCLLVFHFFPRLVGVAVVKTWISMKEETSQYNTTEFYSMTKCSLQNNHKFQEKLKMKYMILCMSVVINLLYSTPGILRHAKINFFNPLYSEIGAVILIAAFQCWNTILLASWMSADIWG